MVMPTSRKLLYFCAVPILLGLFFGWFKADQGGKDLMLRLILTPYWIGFFQIGWLALILSALLGFQVFKPWRPPLWLISFIAPAAFSWLGAYVLNIYIEFLNSFIPDVNGKSSPMQITFSVEFFVNFLSFMTPNFVLFTALNYYFDRGLNQPLFRYKLDTHELSSSLSNDDKKTPATTPELIFLKLISKEKQGKLLAIQAQEHFVKVWTEAGSELIRYKFGTALLELESADGLQIHRSYWVADDAVKRFKKDGPKYVIELVNDEVIPISQSYLRQVRERYAQLS